MTGYDLRRWRQRMRWTQAEAAHALGYSKRSMVRLEQAHQLPERIAKATAAIEAARRAETSR